MVIWLAVITIVTTVQGEPLEFSYPLSSPFQTSRECSEAATKELQEFLEAAYENNLSVSYEASCISFTNQGIL